MRSIVMTPEDRAIFDGLPVQVEGAYRHADAIAASITRRQMRDSGSVVLSVVAEEAALQLRAQRLAIASNLAEFTATAAS